MEKEKSLTKVNNGFFSKLIQNIRIKLFKFREKNQVVNNSVSVASKQIPLDDFEVLKEIMNGNIKIEELDSDLKKRLILMCKKRLNEVNTEIEQIRENTRKINELVLEFKKI